MNSSNQSLELKLKRAEKRAHQHWYEDGIAEIVVGIYFLLLALLFYAQDWLGWPLLMAVGLPLITIGGLFALAPLVQRAKARITYPRTGFVHHRSRTAKFRWPALLLGAAIGLTIGILVGGLVTFPVQDEEALLVWLPLVQATLLALILGLMAHRFDLARYYVLSGISLIVGAAIVVARVGLEVGTAVHMTIMGAAFISAGLITLRNFLRQTESGPTGA
jgi:hypothetical protein